MYTEQSHSLKAYFLFFFGKTVLSTLTYRAYAVKRVGSVFIHYGKFMNCVLLPCRYRLGIAIPRAFSAPLRRKVLCDIWRGMENKSSPSSPSLSSSSPAPAAPAVVSLFPGPTVITRRKRAARSVSSSLEIGVSSSPVLTGGHGFSSSSSSAPSPSASSSSAGTPVTVEMLLSELANRKDPSVC